ncbi:MAG TPA: hypothetical protein VJR89_26020 [Polyangiales bacterium]|nr:hypothetical protein [Polyangiales bacterium]
MKSFVQIALLAALLGCVALAAAQTTNPGADIERFTKARWSQIYPDKDFEGGCVVGFLAFQFSATGYFIYNNHIKGAWRVDELGNLKLRTREGLRFTLMVDGNTLRPSQDVAGVLKRSTTFQRCDE